MPFNDDDDDDGDGDDDDDNNNNNNNNNNNRNSKHVECGSKSNIGNKSCNRNHFIITHTVPEQHTGKARN